MFVFTLAVLVSSSQDHHQDHHHHHHHARDEPHHHWCGFGDARHGVHAPIVVSGAVRMHNVALPSPPVPATEGHHHRRRRLAAVSNAGCAALWNQNDRGVQNIVANVSNMTTRGMKVHFNWEAVDSGSDYAMCNASLAAAGNAVDPCTTSPSGGAPCPFVCTAAKVATAAKIAVAKKRVAWLKTYLEEMLIVRSTASITPTYTAPMRSDQTGSTTIADVDLVIVMTMRSDAQSGIAGYASCVQEDECGRCVVGHFNWCPDVIDPSKALANDQIASERHTALHEVIHILGGMTVARQFRNASTGHALPTAHIVTTVNASRNSWNGAPRNVRSIVTPRALAVYREQSGCASLQGIPIEDQPTGVNAHWEARVLGAEVMSYGTATGEVYLGDITLAFLEDTGQYKGNYAICGDLAVIDTSPPSNKASFLASGSQVVTSEPAPRARSAGYLRWGRDEGCDFFTKTPDVWPERYICEGETSYGCTSDNRLSSVCSQYTYGQAKDGPTAFNWAYSVVSDPPGGSEAETFHRQTQARTYNGQVLSLPPLYTYAKGAGFSSAMDYAPVASGYWNCQHKKPESSETTLSLGSGPNSTGEAATDFTGVFSALKADVEKFSGQAYCPECRCFQSSLREWYKAIDVTFSSYGLCYRSNCFREDYLQFAMEGVGGTAWFTCPKEGGRLFVPGFTGALFCPKAKDFCKFETITGKLYAETSLLSVWLWWSFFFIAPIIASLLLCVCCHLKNHRHCCIHPDALKGTAATVDEMEGEVVRSVLERKADFARAKSIADASSASEVERQAAAKARTTAFTADAEARAMREAEIETELSTTESEIAASMPNAKALREAWIATRVEDDDWTAEDAGARIDEAVESGDISGLPARKKAKEIVDVQVKLAELEMQQTALQDEAAALLDADEKANVAEAEAVKADEVASKADVDAAAKAAEEAEKGTVPKVESKTGGNSDAPPAEAEAPPMDIAVVEKELDALIASLKSAKAKGKVSIAKWKEVNLARFTHLRKLKRMLAAAAAAAKHPQSEDSEDDAIAEESKKVKTRGTCWWMCALDVPCCVMCRYQCNDKWCWWPYTRITGLLYGCCGLEDPQQSDEKKRIVHLETLSQLDIDQISLIHRAVKPDPEWPQRMKDVWTPHGFLACPWGAPSRFRPCPTRTGSWVPQPQYYFLKVEDGQNIIGARPIDVERCGDVPCVGCAPPPIGHICCHTESPWDWLKPGGFAAMFKRTVKPSYRSIWSIIMMVISPFMIPLGVAIFAICIYGVSGGHLYDSFPRHIIWLAFIGLGCVVYGIIGILIGLWDRPTITGLVFTYVSLGITVGCLFILIICSLFDDVAADYLALNWDAVRSNFPSDYMGLNASAALTHYREKVATDYILYYVFGGGGFLTYFALAGTMSACTLGVHTVFAQIFRALAVFEIVVAVLIGVLGIALGTWHIIVVTLVPACMVVAIAGYNLVGSALVAPRAHRKGLIWLLGGVLGPIFLGAALILCGIVMCARDELFLTPSDSTYNSFLRHFSFLGAMTELGVKGFVNGAVKTIGVAQIILGLILLLSAPASILELRRIHGDFKRIHGERDPINEMLGYGIGESESEDSGKEEEEDSDFDPINAAVGAGVDAAAILDQRETDAMIAAGGAQLEMTEMHRVLEKTVMLDRASMHRKVVKKLAHNRDVVARLEDEDDGGY